MSTTITPVGTDYTLILDASFDLHQAGYPNDDAAQSDFEAAYREAAADTAKDLGIEISVINGTYDGPAMTQQSQNGDEGELWQAIHDRLYHDGAEWLYR